MFTWIGAAFVKMFGLAGVSPLLAVRILGALSVTICGYFAYRIVQAAAPAWPYARVAAIPLVTLNPMFTFIGASANSDTLLNVWSAMLFCGVVMALRYGLTAESVLMVCVAVLLGAFTKGRIWVLVPLIPVAVLLGLASAWFRRRSAASEDSPEERRTRYWSDSPGRFEMLLASLSVFALVVWWRQILDWVYFRPLLVEVGPFGQLASVSTIVE